MAITQLTIEGFRSLKRVEWSPAPLNVLIGPNGSGKSNLLRALRLLRSAAGGTLNDAVLSSGGMGALAWDSRAETRIAWSVTLDDNAAYALRLKRIGSSAESSFQMSSSMRAHPRFCGAAAERLCWTTTQIADLRLLHNPQFTSSVTSSRWASWLNVSATSVSTTT